MEDAHLCHSVRKYLEEGQTISHIKEALKRKGHSIHEINSAITEFYKDESTDYDDKLIKEIEKRFQKEKGGETELMQDIFADLLKKGHRSFEIEKAMLRAKLTPKMNVKTALKRWEAYSIIQNCILASTILLGLLYNPVFFIATLFTITGMIMTSLGAPKVDALWWKDFGAIPGVGLWTRDGVFGYNAITGNYWRWRVIDPAVIVSGGFMLLAIVFIHSGFVFVMVCIYLALLSAYCFTIKPADSSGPPYSLLTKD